ncbi:MAG: hypothetical protein DIZ78_17695 [endosymbiont of Escarpia spicata]|uniref:Uncharacterized protein n=1 Tax=endosymbiont of Escarpia spicata TaxID=2200908 RepID=A0A370D951_9GAMM|nr:MAG: hypothetical protein DIZ78_17695 [endosymbiont of Escarpia spicata]
MSKKEKVHRLFGLLADEVLEFIRESESSFSEKWVPSVYIKDQLDLNMSAYPQGNKIDNKTGWLFATIARHLEDRNLLEFHKIGQRSYYRSK